MLKAAPNSWFVYILLCADRSLYTGITTNVQKRFELHKVGKGAKYTRSKKAKQVLHIEEYPDRNSAAKREYEIKQLTHQQKLQLTNSNEVLAI